MLPKSHSKAYQDLLTALENLKDFTASTNVESTLVKKNFQEIKTIYNNQVITLNSDGLDPTIASRWQALQTEIHRALKLLEIDIMFLGSSRKTTTSQSRLTNLRDRLEQLIGYCRKLLIL